MGKNMNLVRLNNISNIDEAPYNFVNIFEILFSKYA